VAAAARYGAAQAPDDRITEVKGFMTPNTGKQEKRRFSFREGGSMRRTIPFLLVAVLALPSACSHQSRPAGSVSSASRTSLPGVLLAAATKTTATTSRVSLNEQVSGVSSTGSETGSQQGLSASATGAFDYAHRRGILHLSAPGSMGMAPTEILFVFPHLYLKLPAGAPASVSGGKPWLGLNVNAMAAQQGAASGGFMPGPGTDPSEELQTLFGASGRVSNLGSETIRGVSTTHYRVVVDMKQAASRLPAAERTAFLAQVRALGTPSIPADVWVDSEHLVRQMRLTIQPPSAGGSAGQARVTVTMQFFDFGTPVHVVAPPVSQVNNLTGLGTSPPP
jgi:hypothetical protein